MTSSDISDFQIDGRTFEIGGKSKGMKQIKEANEGYIVKDQIEYSSGNILPLWWFGLNYWCFVRPSTGTVTAKFKTAAPAKKKVYLRYEL